MVPGEGDREDHDECGLAAGSGRAEACVGSLKSRIRRLLKGAKMDVKFWPMAARYAMVAEEKRQRNELMPAAFGEEVWVRRRSWKRSQDPFGPTYEKARYLAVESCERMARLRWSPG